MSEPLQGIVGSGVFVLHWASGRDGTVGNIGAVHDLYALLLCDGLEDIGIRGHGWVLCTIHAASAGM